MKLIYSTLGCPNWSLEHAADAALASGYVGLEVRVLDGEIISADLPRAAPGGAPHHERTAVDHGCAGCVNTLLHGRPC